METIEIENIEDTIPIVQNENDKKSSENTIVADESAKKSSENINMEAIEIENID